MVRPLRTLLLAVTLTGALAAACGGSDTVPYPDRCCCVASAYYICSSPSSAGRCLQSDSPDPSSCNLQQGVACPTPCN